MAIPTSSGFSPTNCFHPLHQSSKFAIFKAVHHFLSPPWLNPRFIIAHSSAFPSPVLEEEPLPLVEITYEAPNSTYPDAEPNDPDLNKLILDLLGDPCTQDLALEYYKKAKERSGFLPRKATFKSLLRYLVRSKKWDLIPLVCEDMKAYQVFPHRLFCARILSACISARKFRVADMLLETFEIDRQIAALAYETALRSYTKLHMYRICVKSGEIVLDPGGCVLAMEAYLKLGNYKKVVELFSELEASKKLDSLESPVQAYGVLIEALGKLGEGVQAVKQFEQMGIKGIPPNASVYASLIGSLADLREVKIVEHLVEEAECKQMLKDPALFLNLVIMYIEEGLLEKTLDVVKKMKDANLKVSDCILCAIVNGYTKKRGLKEAAKVYEDLISQGCEPGQVTYASVINVYFRLALYSKAKKVFDEMQQKGFDRCVVAYSTMIVMYGKIGQLREAMKLLAKMKERRCDPNVWVYNALIDLHGRANNLKQVDKLWKEMQRRKVRPDRVSYTSTIVAYSKAREYETCMKFYDEYRMNGGKIDLVMAGIMVSVFSKINRIDALIKLLQDMKAEGIKLDVRLYKSAFNALRDAGLQMQVKWLQESFKMTSVEPSNAKHGRPRKIPAL
ncbi:hypothetical protein Cgig2_028368 [Carnegiea gigantea]|uniref:Pentatricopeptide repeat-containing protein n=1 Tax=Carnegiea gigantea TaxID=171969 RepID=A0A9Q1K2G4_9CARY|nr:hypothetical protein Cgig2_028368 [Carnegiea gigantea]